MKIQWRLAALKKCLQDATAYRIEFLFEFLGSAIVPAAMQWVLWYALFQANGSKEVAGMTYHQMVMYTGMSVLFTQIRGGDLDFELQEMIRSGALSNYLLRPVGVVEFVFLRGLAPKLFIAMLCLSVGLVAGMFLGLSPLQMLAAMFMALMGNIIHYQLSAALAATAFFWEEAHSVLMVKNLIVGLLSGELLPLTLFPEHLSWIWKSTPFYLYVFGPTQYALGHWSHTQYFQSMGIGCLWLIGGYLAIRISWGLSIRRYSSLGG